MKWNRAIAFGAFLCVTLSGFGSALPQAGDAPETKSHGLAERRVAFEDAWSHASKENRDRLRAEVRRYRNVGLSALRQVNPARLVRWTRILKGHEVSSLPSDLENWMGKLEVRLIPGWRDPKTAQADPQIITQILAPSQPPGLLAAEGASQFQLHWVNEKGERKLARSVSVDGSDFGALGFELFLQCPANTAGTWWLEPSLSFDNATIWGHPGVFFLREFKLPDLGPTDEHKPKRAWMLAKLDLQTKGFRDMRWGGAEALLLNRHEHFDQSSPLTHGRGTLTARLSPQGKAPARALVWVVVPSAQLLEGEFIGQRGLRWRALAAKGVMIVASHAPLIGSIDSQDTASATMLRETKALSGIPRILVARGNLARGLGAGSKRAFDGFDSLVLQNPRNRDAAPTVPFGEAPTLFLLPSDPWKAPIVPGTQRVVASMDPPAVMSMDTAHHIGQHLDFLAPKKSETTASGAEEH
ncbi:MAG: hypothetical protein GY930_04190 [bacterium]|nr:hypothetical protein [bacterium]